MIDLTKFWKTIVDTLQDGLLVVDARGTLIAVNPAAEKITGYRADELIGHSCRILNCTGCTIFTDGTDSCFCSLYATGEVRAKKCMITTKEKHAVHVIKNASILRDEKGSAIGAVETLTDLSIVVRQQEEIERLRKSCRLDVGFHGIIGESKPVQNMLTLIEHVAPTTTPVMIHGQSGTGKELVAQAVHETSLRAKKPFIKVNCAALNENLLESELFGHRKGSFTGADQTRIGRFEAAHLGTIFLDEIGDIPLSTQVKLLRVLEEKEIERVGEHTPIPVDVRIVTATNKDLDALVEEGLFREDLLFRINVFPIQCPALVDRRDDIPLLVENFIEQNTLSSGKNIKGITPEALEKLFRYTWPGNIRELRNAIEYAFVLCRKDRIGPEHLPPKIAKHQIAVPGLPPDMSQGDEPGRLELIRALKEADGNRSEAAKRLGVSRVTVWKRMKKYGVEL